MKKIKIHILYEFQKGPFGGANQFLKALRQKLIERELYIQDISKANFIIYHCIEIESYIRVLKTKLKYPQKIFINRIDGPLSLYRGSNPNTDFDIYKINQLIADGTVFQSNWSIKKNYLLGIKPNIFETIIINASDNSIFYPVENKVLKDFNKEKCKIIAISWSDNINKGFELYQHLDKFLDFNQYSMKFIGNSPVSFKNIECIKPLEPNKLAKILRESDIYITGSKKDPCSNSLIEAISCGLPCVVLNDGGHPEIIKEGGEVFNNFDECIEKINLIKDNYVSYQKKIIAPKIDDVTDKYVMFFEDIYYSYVNSEYKVKKLGRINYYKFLLSKLIKNPRHTIKILMDQRNRN